MRCFDPASEQTTIAFGRTTHLRDKSCKNDCSSMQTSLFRPTFDGEQSIGMTRQIVSPPDIENVGGCSIHASPMAATLGMKHSGIDDFDSSLAISESRRNSALSSQDSKHIGRQMFASNHDLVKAQEKRKRQISYSREIRHASKQKSTVLQVDSITRIVVQSFRKLINCERCALFLMDHSTNELYFKPIGLQENNSHVKTIRFPTSTGVAGWVATKKEKLNIKNAYQDHRFNQEIDKQTNFRTRTILCMPVLSASRHLLGVIQMVNKMKGDAKVLAEMAKKKKPDEKNPGYQSSYESFSDGDERILERCTAQVSRALEDVFLPSRPESVLENNAASKIQRDSIPMVAEQRRNSMSTINTNQADKRSHVVNNDTRKRRSSIGSLVQFVTSEAAVKPTRGLIKESGMNVCYAEALVRFQFRCVKGPQISAAQGQLESDPDRMLAASKRKRMKDYANKCKESCNQQGEEEN